MLSSYLISIRLIFAQLFLKARPELLRGFNNSSSFKLARSNDDNFPNFVLALQQEEPREVEFVENTRDFSTISSSGAVVTQQSTPFETSQADNVHLNAVIKHYLLLLIEQRQREIIQLIQLLEYKRSILSFIKRAHDFQNGLARNNESRINL